MGTIKLFKIEQTRVEELESQPYKLEKELQQLVERNLELFLKIKFLDSEYKTTKSYSGRIDTLGIDENGSPVIIEYKRSTNENVINQGLFYLDWLLDHKADFTLLVQKRVGKDASENIEWGNARLICIAPEFTKYDEYAVSQIGRNIELIRYRKFNLGIILLELVNATSIETVVTSSDATHTKTPKVSEMLNKLPVKIRKYYEELKSFIYTLGDDVQEKENKNYIAFKRLSNFACIEFHPNDQQIIIFTKVDPKSIQLEEGFSRDVTNLGHYGTGDLELRIDSIDDIAKAKPILQQSYEIS